MADPKNDKQEQGPTEVTEVCSISLDNIFSALHTKAISLVKGCRIQNSAIDEKDGTFIGPGQHIIAALPEKGLEIKIEDAAAGLKTYVLWFNGPEVAAKVTNDVLIPLESSDDKTADNDKSELQSESIYRVIPSFLTYLTEAGEENKESDDNTDEETTDEETPDEESDTDTDDKKDTDTGENKELDIGKQSETAKGYYITYGVEIEGKKGTPLKDAIKKFGADLLKGIGIQSFDWRSGATGKVITLGDVLDSWDAAFKHIDPTLLKTTFERNLKAKFPALELQSVSYFDQNTLIQHLKKKLQSSDKNKLKQTKYSLCVRIPHNDKSRKLVNKNLLADLVTKSISGLYKKFSAKVNGDDIVLIGNYSGGDKAEEENNINVADKKESKINIHAFKSLLLEDDSSLTVEQKVEKLQNLLNTALKSALGEKFKSLLIDKHQKLESILDKKGVKSADNSDVYSALKEHDYGFLIETIEKLPAESDKNTKTLEDSILIINNYLELLFEETDKDKDKNKDKLDKDLIESQRLIRDTLKTTFSTFAKEQLLLTLGQKIEDPNVIKCKSENVEVVENINNVRNVAKLIFEDKTFTKDIQNILYDSYYNNSTTSLLLEAHNNYYLDAIKELKRIGVENLKNNLDKFNKDYKKYIDSMLVKKGHEVTGVNLPKDLELKTQNRKTYIDLLKKKYMKGSSENPFLKGVSAKWRKAKSIEEVINTFDDYTHKPEDKDPEVPECYAAFQALKDLPSGENTNEENDGRLEIIFMDIEKPGELDDPLELTDADKEKYELLGEPVKVLPGEDINIPTVKNKGKWKFTGFEPDPRNMDESGKTYAMYMDEPITTIQFYDDKNGSDEIALDNPIVFEDPDDIDETKIEYPNEDEIKDKYKSDKLVFSEFDPDKETLLKNIKPREENKVFVRYIEREPVMVTIEFKDVNPEDPDNEKEWTDIDEPITIDVEELDTLKYPEPPEHEGFEFEKWDKSEDELKSEILNAVEDNETDSDKTKNESYRYFNRRLTLITEATDDDTLKFIVKTVYKKVDSEDNGDGLQKLVIQWVCTDNNGLLDKIITVIPKAPKKEFKDPTNEKNKKILDPVGEPIKYKPGEELKLPEPPKFDGYEFTGWKPDAKEILAISKKIDKPIETVAQYKAGDNTSELKTDKGNYDYYLIPIKKLDLEHSEQKAQDKEAKGQ